MPFGFGLLAFLALVVLALMAGYVALSLILGGLDPVPNQPPVNNGPGNADVPAISDRFFDSGTARSNVSGALALNGALEIDPISSYAQEGLGWIFFTDGDAEVLVALNEPENSVTVARGDLNATGIDDDCTFQVEVTDALISGRITCPSVDVLRGDSVVGAAAIDLEFTAGS